MVRVLPDFVESGDFEVHARDTWNDHPQTVVLRFNSARICRHIQVLIDRWHFVQPQNSRLGWKYGVNWGFNLWGFTLNDRPFVCVWECAPCLVSFVESVGLSEFLNVPSKRRPSRHSLALSHVRTARRTSRHARASTRRIHRRFSGSSELEHRLARAFRRLTALREGKHSEAASHSNSEKRAQTDGHWHDSVGGFGHSRSRLIGSESRQGPREGIRALSDRIRRSRSRRSPVPRRARDRQISESLLGVSAERKP